MDHDGIIRGDSLRELIKKLKQDNTLVKMEVAGRDVDQLTVITGLRNENGTPYFQIDCSQEIQQALSDPENMQISFRYTGEDNLPYMFKTNHVQVTPGGVWARYPDFVERKQKRKDFRVDVPFGSRMKCLFNESVYKLPINNLSLGGALITDKRTGRAARKRPALKSGDQLENLEILFPRGDSENNLHIRKARVIRIQRDTKKKLYQYGLQFSGMTMEEEKMLTQAIYRMQRRLLRKRLPITP